MSAYTLSRNMVDLHSHKFFQYESISGVGGPLYFDGWLNWLGISLSSYSTRSSSGAGVISAYIFNKTQNGRALLMSARTYTRQSSH